MVIQILTSVEDNFAYGYNLGYLRRAIQRDEVHLDGQPNNHHPDPQPFAKRSVYFFTRTAKATIRDNIVGVLSRPDVLPELQREGEQKLKKICQLLKSIHKLAQHQRLKNAQICPNSVFNSYLNKYLQE